MEPDEDIDLEALRWPWPTDPCDHERPGECEACGGTGEVCIGSTTATWYNPPEPIMEKCGDCDNGWSIPNEPLELEEFEEMFCSNLEPARGLCHI